MGFSTVFSGVVMITIFLFSLFSLLVMYKGYVQTTREGMQFQQERMSNKVHTLVTITGAFYDAVEGRISLNLTNDGSTQLDPGYLDVYVNDQFIPRSNLNRTINITTNVVNYRYWDPGEYLTINVSYPLWSGNHYVQITTEYGVKDARVIAV